MPASGYTSAMMRLYIRMKKREDITVQKRILEYSLSKHNKIFHLFMSELSI